MKTNFFRIVIPAVAILLALGGSFVSHASEKKTNANVSAWIIPIGATQCMSFSTCSNIVSPVLCTVTYQSNTYQAFNKEAPSDTTCNVLLFKPIP